MDSAGSQKHPEPLAPTSCPRWEESPPLSPEIHRSMVLQITDLNSWVLNQDWGKQQQKLVYMALLRSEGSLWEGKSSQSVPVSLPPEQSPGRAKGLGPNSFPTPGCLPAALGCLPALVSLRMLLRNLALCSHQPPLSSSPPPLHPSQHASTVVYHSVQCFCTLPRAQPRR